MGDVFIRVSAETATAVQNLIKVAGAEEKIEGGAKRAKAAVDSLSKAFQGIGKNMTDIRGGAAELFSGLDIGPVKLATDAVNALREAWKKAKHAAREYQEDIADLEAAESLAKDPKLQNLFDSVNAPGITSKLKVQLYQGLRKDLSGPELEDAFRAMVAQAPAIPQAQLGEYGNLVASLKNMMPKMGLSDVMDAADKIFETTKGDLSKFDKKSLEQMLDLGMSPERAMGNVLSFGKTEQGTRALQRMVDLSTEQRDFEPLKRGQKVTADEAQLRAFFAETDKQKRFRALEQDASLRQQLMGGNAAEASIGLRDAGLYEREVREAIMIDNAQKRLERALGKPIAEARANEAIREEVPRMLGNGPVAPLMRLEDRQDTMESIAAGGDTEIGKGVVRGALGPAGQVSSLLLNAIIQLTEEMKRNTDTKQQNTNASTE